MPARQIPVLSTFAALALLATTPATTRADVVDIGWICGFLDGAWTDAGCWQGFEVPDTPTECAGFPVDASGTVTLSTEIEIGGLTIVSEDLLLALAAPNGNLDVVDGDVFNDATIRVGDADGDSHRLHFSGAGTKILGGVGRVELHPVVGDVSSAGVSAAAQIRIAHGEDHQIRGGGTIEADMDNDGILLATLSTTPLRIDGEIVQGGTGRITGGNGATAQLASGTRVEGGRLNSFGGGRILVPGGAVNIVDVEIDGIFDIEGGGITQVLIEPGGITNNGTIRINPDGTATACVLRCADTFVDVTIEGDGSIELGGTTESGVVAAALGANSNSSLTLGAGQTLRGTGALTIGDIVNDGLLVPDQLEVAAGVTLTQSGIGTLRIEIAGPGDFGRIINNGTFDAGGTLEVVFVDGYAPQSAIGFKVVDVNGVQSTFQTVSTPTPPAGYLWRTVYATGGVFVVQTCPEDANASGAVDIADLNIVLATFGASVTPFTAGDVTGDGVVDIADLSAILATFGQGC